MKGQGDGDISNHNAIEGIAEGSGVGNDIGGDGGQRQVAHANTTQRGGMGGKGFGGGVQGF